MITKKEKFYITTAIDYASGAPHLGHAYEKIAADVLARWNRNIGKEVFFQTGMDEHGQKIKDKANEIKKEPQEFVDLIAKQFENLIKKLNISTDSFIRTTDEKHKKVVQLIIQKAFDKGDIYKGNYEGLYCVGCERYYTEDELIEGKICPEHKKEVEFKKEENYFFALSKYQKKLLDFYEKNPNFISPESKRKEILNRVEEGLNDISISRDKKNLTWGIELPFDKNHVTYVWFDALFNYYSGTRINGKENFWPADVQIIGHDISWFHIVYWPAFLMSVGLDLPKKVFSHGMILDKEGHKMSKSLGNVIDPIKFSKEYGLDEMRYFLISAISFGDDLNFSLEKFAEKINNELNNDLGNLVSRIHAMTNKYFDGVVPDVEIFTTEDEEYFSKLNIFDEFNFNMQELKFNQAFEILWTAIRDTNAYVNKVAPWKEDNKKRLGTIISILVSSIKMFGKYIDCIMPEKSEKLRRQYNFKHDKIFRFEIVNKGHKLGEEETLFREVKEFKYDLKNLENVTKSLNNIRNSFEKISNLRTPISKLEKFKKSLNIFIDKKFIKNIIEQQNSILNNISNPISKIIEQQNSILNNISNPISKIIEQQNLNIKRIFEISISFNNINPNIKKNIQSNILFKENLFSKIQLDERKTETFQNVSKRLETSEKNKIKNIIFDFDGVIHNSIKDMYEVHCKTLEKCSFKDWKKNVFNGNAKLALDSFSEKQKLNFWNSWKKVYNNFKLEKNIRKELENLSKNYQLFIVSSNSEKNLKMYFENNNFTKIFKEILGIETNNSKEEKFKILFNKDKINNKNSIFITDSLGDILEANKVKLKTIAVDFGVHTKENLQKANPFKIVSKFNDIRKTIEDLNNLSTTTNNLPQQKPQGFSSLNLKVGKILSVKQHPEAEKLFIEEIDLGEEKPRQIVSGLTSYYKPQEMLGKKVIVVCNLKPAKLRGVKSEGMVLVSESKSDSNKRLGLLFSDAEIGTNLECNKEIANSSFRIKIDDFFKMDFKSDGEKVYFDGKVVVGSGKEVVVDRKIKGIVC